MSSETPGKPASEPLDVKPPLTTQSDSTSASGSLPTSTASATPKSQSQPLVSFVV